MILAIDPGNIESAYCVIEKETYKPIIFDKVNNDNLISIILPEVFEKYDISNVIIEMIASYGMAVGSSVFDTCVWIGRFYEKSLLYVSKTDFIYRKEEKINLCGSMKAKDSNIRQALIDRFGIVGVKKSPGWFYGFKKDIWASYAVGVTWLDKQKELNK